MTIASLQSLSAKQYRFPRMSVISTATLPDRIGICSDRDAELLCGKLVAFGLPADCDYAPEDIALAAAGDKKRRGNTVTLVVPKAAGNCILNPVTVEKVVEYARLGLGGKA